MFFNKQGEKALRGWNYLKSKIYQSLISSQGKIQKKFLRLCKTYGALEETWVEQNI